MSQFTTRIEIQRFHRIMYAHTHTAENYSYSLNSASVGTRNGQCVSGGVLEIGFVERIPLVFRDEDGLEHTAAEGDVFVIPPMRRLEVASARPGLHRHVTTEAMIDCRLGDAAEPPALLVLPLIVRGSPVQEKIIAAIRRTANKCSPAHGADHFRQCADFMGILAALGTTDAPGEGAGAPPSHTRYCAEAEQFILNNIGSKLRVEDIAAAIGISRNYLTNIFSATRGMPLIEYINRLKLNHMVELMLRFGCSVREAGEYVGLENVNYISRMFRKYYGVTVSEYKRSLM